MKKYVLILLLLYNYNFLYSQEFNFYTSNSNTINSQKSYVVSEIYYTKQKENAVFEAKRAKRLKITGLVFTGLGSAGILTTTPFVIIYAKADGNSKYYGDFAAAIVGGMGYIPSTACLITGIPMAIVGYKKANKLKEQTLKEF